MAIETVLLTCIIVALGVLAYYAHAYAQVLLAGLLPAYLLRTTVGGVPTNLLEILIVILLLAGVSQSVVRAQWQYRWQHTPWQVKGAVGVFLVAAGVSTYISPHLETSLGILKGWIIFPVLGAWVITTASQAGHYRRVLTSLTLSGVGMTMVAFWGYVPFERLAGLYDVPNSLALFLVPLTVMNAWQACIATTPSLRHVLYAGVLAAGVAATQSVAAIGALCVALVGGVVVWRHTISPVVIKKSAIGIGVIVLSAVVLLVGSGRATYLLRPFFISDSPPTSATVRWQLWHIGVELITEYPVLGVGLGQFEPAYQQVLHQRFVAFQAGEVAEQPIPEFVFRDPHNWLIAFWLNLGVVGLLSFSVLHWYAFRSWFRQADQGNSLYQAVLLALGALLLVGLFDTIYWKNDLALLQWLLLSILLAPPRATVKERERGYL